MLIVPMILTTLVYSYFFFTGETSNKILRIILITIWLTYASTACVDMLGEALGLWSY